MVGGRGKWVECHCQHFGPNIVAVNALSGASSASLSPTSTEECFAYAGCPDVSSRGLHAAMIGCCGKCAECDCQHSWPRIAAANALSGASSAILESASTEEWLACAGCRSLRPTWLHAAMVGWRVKWAECHCQHSRPKIAAIDILSGASSAVLKSASTEEWFACAGCHDLSPGCLHAAMVGGRSKRAGCHSQYFGPKIAAVNALPGASTAALRPASTEE